MTIKRPPVERIDKYLRWGTTPAWFQAFDCPECGSPLSAGPNYQPKFCPECGQALDFTGIVYKEGGYLKEVTA